MLIPGLKDVQHRLILLGSEGVLPESEPIWRAITANEATSLAVASFPGTKPSLTYSLKLECIRETCSRLAVGCRISDAREISAEPFSGGDVIYLSVENPRQMCEMQLLTPTDRAAALWRASLQAYCGGTTLVAGAGAAVTLGCYAYSPQQPYRADVSATALELRPGADLVADATIVPYFEHVPHRLVEALCRLLPAGAVLIGIDQTSAVMVTNDASRCLGLGKVTILRDNGIAWKGSNEDIVPSDLISLTLSR